MIVYYQDILNRFKLQSKLTKKKLFIYRKLLQWDDQNW
jgi:hypothetical protein